MATRAPSQESSASRLVDQVGEVVPLPARNFTANPPTLDPLWRDVSRGVHRQEGQLVIALDVGRVLAQADVPAKGAQA